MAVAVTVMVWADVIVAGAVYVAVPPPVGVSVPTCGFIVQVTEVSLLPVTVAVNVWDCPAGRLEPGLTETETAAGGGAAPLDTISIASIFAAPITGLRRMIICPVLTETAALISTAVLAPPA